ncbi:hypothetical protein CBS147333_8270 [Penicillium roqueforti]|nr:hypothetical protein CBS147333_8270 [Penicillium roqueforti]KAI3180308.1 hypothetical protein DTO046C5_1544 [Penicillium roqueforti]KAI3195160.1 hypothetical protein CBS147311_8145 [Penicillium roqueforti]KAI3273046.1 hypothetical protein CBS147308_3106 [Penicillium roqueforti]KAI3294499.1 hypothetical protein DTO003C3_2532 [Penicillium roqueforti]
MKNCEDIAIQQGRLREDQQLSGPMNDSWESGDFWILYAALHSFAFDGIYWQKIDSRLFGPTESIEDAWKERLDLLDEGQKDEMELLLDRKLQEMNTRVLSWDPDAYTLAFHQQSKSQEEKANEEKGKREEQTEEHS